MRAVIQRVQSAAVTVSGRPVSSIRHGFLVFLGIAAEDTSDDLEYIVTKIAHLRAFEDGNGKMNLGLFDTGGEVLVVSQFTLLADCRKGRRPSFTGAAAPDKARRLYDECRAALQALGLRVSSGIFQEMMEVALVNDGPVTFLLDSSRLL